MANVPQLVVTPHIFKSVRAWIHDLYPLVDIHIERAQGRPGKDGRPSFRMDIAVGPNHIPMAPGMFMEELTLSVRFMAESLMQAHEVVGQLVHAATPPNGRIEMSLYDAVWPAGPAVSFDANLGGSLPSEVDIAVAAVTAGGRSAPSQDFTVAVPANHTLRIAPQMDWPHTGMVTAYEIYAAKKGEPVQFQGTTSIASPVWIMQSLVQGGLPATKRQMKWKGMRVIEASGMVMEQPDSEQHHDAILTLRLQQEVHRVLVGPTLTTTAPTATKLRLGATSTLGSNPHQPIKVRATGTLRATGSKG